MKRKTRGTGDGGHCLTPGFVEVKPEIPRKLPRDFAAPTKYDGLIAAAMSAG
jgi:hypothetical protein